ncbi:sulfite exporter TauE/SafE family protein [Hoeflea sp. CAU 1731]
MDILSLLTAEHLVFLISMIGAGVVGGLIAGLLGVGGGIVIVPVLYSVLVATQLPEAIAIKLSVATSLATIIVTSLSSASSHSKRGAVDYALLRSWAAPIIVGVVIGTTIAGYVGGEVLTLVFAVVALVVAVNMLLRANNAALTSDFPNASVKFGSGVGIGLISSMMGIGGGTLGVPILTAFGFDIRRAVGTAAAIGFVIAVPATIGYIIAGWGASNLPPFSIGYVNLLGFIAIVPLTTLFAPVGAKIAHAIPRRVLSYCFAGFLVVTSARMFYSLLS